ncbi:MAG: hypothetical protein ACT6FG_08450 [Methanosarcinaceae archaeon]
MELDENPYEPDEEDAGIDTLNVDNLAPPVEFERPDLINALDLRTPSYRKRAITIIDSQPVSIELKQALAEWVVSHLDEGVLLADFSKDKRGMFNSIVIDPQAYALETSKLDLDIKLLSACHADCIKSWYGSLRDDLMFVMSAYLSRTSGPHRERLENSTFKSTSEVTNITGQRVQQAEPKKKKGFF